MRKWTKVLLWLLGIVSVVIVAPIIALIVDLIRPCDADYITRVVSPDRKWEAVSYRAACGGATMPFATHIAILRPGKAPRGRGQIYSADDSNIRLRWTSPNSLIVQRPREIHVFWTKPVMHGISINYQEY
jgi:hypothetical protein